MTERLSATQQQAYRSAGALPFAGVLPARLITPAREIALAMIGQPPDQDMLSGVNNPFGHHACAAQAWSFLDIAENPKLLDCVEDVLGPDIILWDVELYLERLSLQSDEGQGWPVDPLAGAVAVVSLESGDFGLIDIGRLAETFANGPALAIRYMPATSRFNRDHAFSGNRRATETRPLVNYTKRPIWLMRGEDHANNDFVTGFMVPAARWSDAGLGDGAITSHRSARPLNFRS